MAYLLMNRFAKQGIGPLAPEQVSDFITFAALFGVVLGGRLGYMLLYNFDGLISNPLSFFKLRDGGMASHGGIAGLFFFTLFYAKKHNLSWTGIGDNLVTVSPLGILFGRIANFINGELYGRITNVPWAVKFPTEVHHHGGFVPAAPTNLPLHALPEYSHEILQAVDTLPNGRAELEAILNPRHPSQLYEGALEGLLLFLILFTIRIRYKNLPHGILTGLFFILYAIFRISVENYREPDSTLILDITKGQFYSIFMIGVGVAFLILGYLRRKHPRNTANPA